MRTIPTARPLLLSPLLLPLALAAGGGGPAAAGGEIMPALAREFRAVDEALAAGDVAAAAPRASTLREIAKDIGLVEPHFHADGGDVFAAAAERALALATELEQLTGAGELAAAVHALDDLRATCVSCHVRFRDPTRIQGDYPARGNTLVGRVAITTTKGEVRTDRGNVLVFLEGDVPEWSRRLPRSNPRILQKDSTFLPRVLPIVRGSTVEFPNDDVIYHNVFSLSAVCPFDLGAYGPGSSKSVPFPRSGLVRLYCNMHPNMVSSIVVLENGCFALTDRLGYFVIPDLPDGTYRLRTWHEFGGDLEQEVRVGQGAIVRKDLQIVEDRVTVPHKNKYGRPYRDKY